MAPSDGVVLENVNWGLRSAGRMTFWVISRKAGKSGGRRLLMVSQQFL